MTQQMDDMHDQGSQTPEPQLSEEAKAAISYSIDCWGSHAESNNVSLGCDISLAWLKKVAGKTLTEDEKLLLSRHLNIRFR